MKKLNYQPKPVDTTDVVLSPELMALGELIAENVHEMWAESRMKEGWIYGPQRDDAKKTHPCLIPYGELPESEKAYDRNSSMETLKLITRLGFTIIPGDLSKQPST